MLAVAATESVGWNFYPGPLFILLPVTIAYIVRWRAVRAHPGRLVLFMLGITAVVVALYSPIDELGDELLTMHMIQHLLLIDIAPILCFLGLTKAIFRPATKRLIVLERSAPWLLSPLLGVAAYIGGMWLWHVPALYDAAVRYPVVHALEHLTFTVIGGLYWWHLISPIRDTRRLSGMGAVMYMAGTKVFVGLLGIALTFIPRSIYPVYQEQANRWGITAAEDQSIAGVLMATEQSIIMGIALVWLVVQAIDRSEKEQLRKERFGDPGRAAPKPGGSRELY
ncbi:MAG: cytochrome c oxidase assembly protein [Solirubrobacteraceae bacterium]|nr:cytochrome c oxidase assembly protein [Solirubrobacteraceae bacterium]